MLCLPRAILLAKVIRPKLKCLSEKCKKYCPPEWIPINYDEPPFLSVVIAAAAGAGRLAVYAAVGAAAVVGLCHQPVNAGDFGRYGVGQQHFSALVGAFFAGTGVLQNPVAAAGDRAVWL